MGVNSRVGQASCCLRVLFALGLLLLGGGAGAPPDESGTKEKASASSAIPPYQRLLTGEDAKKSEELEDRILELEIAGKLREALTPAREIAQLRERLQGSDHWQTVNSRLEADALALLATRSQQEQAEYGNLREIEGEAESLEDTGRHAEGEALRERALDGYRRILGDESFRTAGGYSKLAKNLNAQGKYDLAQPLFQKALTLYRKILGEEHPDTTKGYNNVAYNLNCRGKHAEAQPLYEKALTLSRQTLGDEDADTAMVYGNLAGNLADQGKFAEAQPLHEKALALYRKSLGAEAAGTATAYNNLASNLQAQGKYAEAQPLLEEALSICRKLLGEEHADTARGYNNLAGNLLAQGRHAEAQPLQEKALVLFRKVLGEEHPSTATARINLAGILSEQAKFAEAQPLFESALVLFRKVLGEEHPNTAAAYLNLAGVLNHQAKYAEAQVHCEKALALYRKLLGEEHPDTALAYNLLAGNLSDQGKCTDAQPILDKLLLLRRRLLGEEHPATCTAYNNLAINLYAQGKYAEAKPLLERTLLLRLRILAEHPETASSYNNLGMCLFDQGKYAEAQPLLEKGLELRRKLLGEEHPDTAESYSNLGLTLYTQGKFWEAQPLYEKALAIKQKVFGEEHPTTATGYNNLALNVAERGRLGEAQTLLEKTLRLRLRILGEHPETAVSYSNLGMNLYRQGRIAEAQPYFEKALELRRSLLGEEHPDTAQSYSNLAMDLASLGRYADAQSLLEKALDLQRRLLGEQHPSTATSYKNLAETLWARGRYAEALKPLEKAVEISEKTRLLISFQGLERALVSSTASPFPFLLALLAREGRPEEAWRYWEAGLARGLLDDLSAREARKLSEADRTREEELLRELGRLETLFSTPPAGRAQDSPERERKLEALRQRQVAVWAELSAFREHLVDTYGVVEGRTYDLSRIRSRLSPDTALVGWVDIDGLSRAADPNGEHWALVVRSSGDPVSVKIPGCGHDGGWTKDDDLLGTTLAAHLADRQPLPEGTSLDGLTAALARQRLAPLEPHLGKRDGLPDVRRLIVLPSPSLRGVPICALTDRYTISYAPSGTVLAWVRERAQRDRPGGRPTLLALGDPVFGARGSGGDSGPTESPPEGLFLAMVQKGSSAERGGIKTGDVLLSYGKELLRKQEDLTNAIQTVKGEVSVPVTVWRRGERLSLTVSPGKLGVRVDGRPTREALLAQREFEQVMRAAREGSEGFPPLPATRNEVEAIADRFRSQGGEVACLLGSNASEQRLSALVRSGKVSHYRYLHLATHGVPNIERAFDSALILSQDQIPDPLEAVLSGREVVDARLTAAEILRNWTLNADLVVLSACQTAVGRYAGGEGYLGFSQALLLSGARSVVLTLWKVDDRATAILMTRFYENLLGSREGLKTPLPKAEALEEAQVWLRGISGAQVTKYDRQLGFKDDEAQRGTSIGVGREKARVSGKPFEHPRYWAAFILVGDFE